ncbi:sugar isomerase [Priestia megaterium]|uniref:SIS domain-containing protein n=2 Tax=Priestia megaterium TaxID=1404 RepID=UPI000BF4A57D|nr:SIS domain-containing protein [Priestia megaterium]PFK98554.1 sugar isomerase [Priestia megaterium]PGK31719.1 sugar isomerase [Priestia megaterium]RCX18471.1 fructoselysine-6-phosphate deglycase [Bacillus sp. AG236]
MLKFNPQNYLKVTNGAVLLRAEIEKKMDEVSKKEFKNLFLIGSGGSIAIMYPFEYIWNSTSTIPAYAEIASEFMLQSHKQFDKNSVVILSSLSGTTEETVEAAQYCKERGATTIGLVGEMGTPLANIVDYPIANYAENDYAADSINLQMYMIIFRLMHNNGEFPKYDKFVSELEKMPENLISVKEQAEEKAKEFANKYKDEDYHMLIGSGTAWGRTYAYSMCVLEEMQWIRTKSVHAAEFFHGTIELVERDTSIILLKGEDATRPLADRVERFAEKYTDKLTIFDTKDYTLEGISPEFRQYFPPLVLGSLLQRVSVHLEDKRNHSLDKRRYYRTVAY